MRPDQRGRDKHNKLKKQRGQRKQTAQKDMLRGHATHSNSIKQIMTTMQTHVANKNQSKHKLETESEWQTKIFAAADSFRELPNYYYSSRLPTEPFVYSDLEEEAIA